jgi:hypothetical protein
MAPHTDVETTAQPIITDLLARICNFTAEADMSIGSAALQYTADYMLILREAYRRKEAILILPVH